MMPEDDEWRRLDTALQSIAVQDFLFCWHPGDEPSEPVAKTLSRCGLDVATALDLVQRLPDQPF